VPEKSTDATQTAPSHSLPALSLYGGFLSANMTKLVEGGWVPLLLGGLIFCVMLD
jgi:K+ transporter